MSVTIATGTLNVTCQNCGKVYQHEFKLPEYEDEEEECEFEKSPVTAKCSCGWTLWLEIQVEFG